MFRILESQIDSLEELFKYIEDKHLASVDQIDVKKRCIKEWGLPEYKNEHNPNRQRRPPQGGNNYTNVSIHQDVYLTFYRRSHSMRKNQWVSIKAGINRWKNRGTSKSFKTERRLYNF